MSRRARARALAQEMKRAEAYMGPDHDDIDSEGGHPDAYPETEGIDWAAISKPAAPAEARQGE